MVELLTLDWNDLKTSLSNEGDNMGKRANSENASTEERLFYAKYSEFLTELSTDFDEAEH